MKKHYSFPKIGQYHQTIRNLKLQYSYQGKDDNGDPIYKEPDTWPVVKFIGHVKLHGTNFSLVFSKDGTFYAQSRENIIDEVKDNAGSAHFAYKDGHKIFDKLKDKFVSGVKHCIIYAEWAGGSIQKGVALNKLPKMMVVFGCKLVFEDDTTEWIDSSDIYDESIGVYHINRAPIYEIEVDLNRPDKSIEQMNQWVDEIDKECPFSKTFGVVGVGEGLVFSLDRQYGFSDSFKCKGSSHSESKIKKLPTVDVQKMDNLQQAIDTHCHEDRMLQIYDKVVKTEADKVPQNIANFIRLLVEDCWIEEGDSIRASDISRKEFGSAVSKKAAKWFQNKLQDF